MFGNTNSGPAFGSPFGANNNANNSSANGGGLFGAKPATATTSNGFGFGASSNNNAANTSSGSLFGNSNTTNNNGTSTGGLFGNNNNTQQPSGGLFGNSNNNNAASGTTNGGGLFGNNNANTSSGGLFGNSATSSPAPSGGLFGNSTASKPSLFGSNTASSTAPKPSLFGSNTASTAPKPSLFGNSTTTQPQQAAGLFGNSTTTAPQTGSSLFGNNSNSTQSFNPMLNTTPMKQYNFKDMPKSLTDSTKKTIHNTAANRKRSLSNSSSSSIPIVQTARSSLIEKLGSRFSTLKSQVYNSEGLFSPKKDLIQSTHTDKSSERSTTVTRGHFFRPFGSGAVSTRSVRAPRSTATDYLKLKVDPARTEARRLKIFGESGGARKMRYLGHEEDSVLTIQETAESKLANGDVAIEEEEEDDKLDESEDEKEPEAVQLAQTYDNDYWCSPSIEELQQLPLRQLAEVSGFTIGRKGYGVIRFELPVDLTAFGADLAGKLFGDVVRFARRGTVEVYPNGRVPLGSGLNVPATITLEKVMPVSKTKTQSTDAKVKDLELRLFVKRLKEMKDMEFITYDPINGSWTFRVKHFSIWGLVDEEDAVVDVDQELKNLKKQGEEPRKPTVAAATNAAAAPSSTLFKAEHVKRPAFKSSNPTEDTFIYKKQKQDNSFDFDTTAFMPGSFITEDLYQYTRQQNDHVETIAEEEEDGLPQTANILSEMDTDDEYLEDAKVPLGLVTHNDDSFLQEEEQDFGVVERQFEPENVDDTDFEVLDADPKLAVADDWDRQLELSARFDSAFGNTNLKTTTIHDAPFSKALTPGDLDRLLYGDFEKVIKSRKALKKEFRLDGYKFAEFASTNEVLTVVESTASHVSAKSLKPFYGTQADLGYKKHMTNSKVSQRRNGFPHVVKNEDISFKLVADSLLLSATSNEKTVWELASVLFDNNVNEQLNGVTDANVVNRVLQIQRCEGLISWLKREVKPEIDTKLEKVSDHFEQMFLLLTSFNISGAAKLAIKTNNPHLSVLISLLGSNDPDVRKSAKQQLSVWKKQAVIQTIPQGLLKIYYLLSGDVLTTDPLAPISKDLSWKAKLGLLLQYGDLNDSLSDLLVTFIQSESANVPQEDVTYFSILKLYVHSHVSLYSLTEIFSQLKTNGPLDVRLQWYVYEILMRSTQRMSFGGVGFGDRLTLSFSEQLQSCGMWFESFFVLLHLHDDDLCKRYVCQLLSSQYEVLSKKKLLDDLIGVLKIPQSAVYEAKALFFRYSGDHWAESDALLAAERYEEAHATLVSHVAPAAVISNGPKLRELEKLISRFPEGVHPADWSVGLGVYKNYLKLALKKGAGEAQLRYLLDALPSVKQTNFHVKVAVKLMCKTVVQRMFELEKREGPGALALDTDKVTRLPLGETEVALRDLLQGFMRREALV